MNSVKNQRMGFDKGQNKMTNVSACKGNTSFKEAYQEARRQKTKDRMVTQHYRADRNDARSSSETNAKRTEPRRVIHDVINFCTWVEIGLQL